MRTQAICIGAAALMLAAGCGDDEQPATPTVTVTAPSASSTAATSTTPDPAADAPPGPAETPTEDPRATELARDAEALVRQYVEALNGRDGQGVCDLFAPAALDGLRLPEQRGDCAASLSASIGYRDPRGLPVWEDATVPTVRITEIDNRSATVVATVVSHFADRDEASVEDDVIYLVRSGGRWLIAKPSATLYRAVGIADVPPSVLAPPG